MVHGQKNIKLPEVGRAKDLSAPLYILLIIIIGGIVVLYIYNKINIKRNILIIK